jgi:WD40 repeat protein
MQKRTAVFISHSSQDNAIAGEVRARLEAQGFPAPFLDYHPETGIPAGHDWEHEIYRQLKRCGAVVYVGSERSAASKWCFAELAIALSLDKPIFPLRIDGEARQPLLDNKQWTDLRGDKEEGYKRLFRGMKALGFDPDTAFVWNASRSPYPGLPAFEEEDAAVFFGREEETEALSQRVNNSHLESDERFITVIGASGSGKSSLVRAGLIPSLRRTGAPWLVAEPMVPSEEPLEMLARSLARTIRSYGKKIEWNDVLKTLVTPKRGLVSVARDLLDHASRDHRLVLIFIDQGEELVTRASDTARAKFVRIIKGALTGPDVIRVVATLRSEFLTSALQQTELADFIYEPFLLAPLPRSRLASAIAGPAEIAGIDLAPGLVERIVEDTGGGDALPLMAFTLERLYQRLARKKSQQLDEADYRAVGGVNGALEQRANGIRDKLDRTGLKRRVMPALLKLVGFDSGGVPTRRRVGVNDLSREERKIIQAFEDARLVSSDGTGPAAVVFVAHEALFRTWRPLADAIEANLEALRDRSRLERDAREWAEAGRDDAYLLRGERLQRALQLRTGGTASGPEVAIVGEFVDASRGLRDRMLGREADLLANRIIKEHREDPERAMLVLMAAIKAYGKRPRLQLALSYAALAPGIRLHIESGHDLSAVALSPDGSLLAAGGAGGRVIVKDESGGGVQWEREVGKKLAPPEAVGYGDRITSLAFGGSGTFLAATRGYNRSVFLLNPRSGRPMRALDARAVVTGLDCSEHLIAGAAGETLRIWSATAPHKLLCQIVLPAPIHRVQIAGDETRAAIATRQAAYVVDLGFDLVYRRSPAELTARQVVGEGDDIRAIAISPDGKLFASARSAVATVWGVAEEDRSGGFVASTLRAINLEKVVHYLKLTADRRLITGDWARGLRSWDIDTGAEVGAVVPQDSTGDIVAISGDGARVATIKKGKTLSAWQTREHGPRLRVCVGNAFSHARFAGQDQFLVTRSMELSDGHVILRDARTGVQVRRVAAASATADDITVSPDGNVVAINEESGVVCRSIPDFAEVRRLPLDGPNHVVFDRSGLHGIVTANFKGDIQSWRSGKPKTLANVGDFYAGSLDLTPDGRQALVASNKRVLLLDLATGKEVFRQPVAKSGDLHAAIAPDGSCIVVGQSSRLWALNMDGSPRIEFAWGKYNVNTNWAADVGHLAFSPDSTRLATATGEGWIYLWDVATGELIQLMRVDDEPLKDLAFSLSGQEIVTCTAEFEGEYDSTGYAEVWPAPDVDSLIALARQRTFRRITSEELAQYGLSEKNATGSAASMFHLTRR